MMNSTLYLISILFLLSLPKCSDEPVAPPPPPVHQQQDTTSHNVTWEVIRFGRVALDGSLFRDIYALNDSDVWAVGQIRTDDYGSRDSLGRFVDAYNAVHWDGKEWTLYRLNNELRNGIPAFINLYAVYGFPSSNWVFVPAADSRILALNGSSVESISRPIGSSKGQITKMWGKSFDDIYFSGDLGSLTHYHNGQFKLVVTITDGILDDIYGSPDGHVYTGGWDFSKGIGTFLQIYDGRLASLNRDEWSFANTFYCTQDTLYTHIVSGMLIQAIHDTAHYRVVETSNYAERLGGINSMRGTGDNNIFAVGYYETILHYNGKTWKLLSYLKGSPIHLLAVTVTQKFVYAVGEDASTGEAIIYKGEYK